MLIAESTYVDHVSFLRRPFRHSLCGDGHGRLFARFSRPYARVIFSNVAAIMPFNGVPTLMFRAADRGNRARPRPVSVSFARQATTRKASTMRRFEELKY